MWREIALLTSNGNHQPSVATDHLKSVLEMCCVKIHLGFQDLGRENKFKISQFFILTTDILVLLRVSGNSPRQVHYGFRETE